MSRGQCMGRALGVVAETADGGCGLGALGIFSVGVGQVIWIMRLIRIQRGVDKKDRSSPSSDGLRGLSAVLLRSSGIA